MPLVLALALAACGSADTTDVATLVDEAAPEADPCATALDVADGVVDEADPDGEVVTVVLADGASTADGAGVEVDGDVITFTAAGLYRLSGTLSAGQVRVDTADADDVVLWLEGVDVTAPDGPALYVVAAEKVELFLGAGSVNRFTDAATYAADDRDDAPTAAIFSMEDLRIAGPGALEVEGRFADGISSKDALKLTNGLVTVTAVDDGLRGKDHLSITGGGLRVTSGGDGLKADNDTDAGEGYVAVEGGVVTIDAGDDGISAFADVLLVGGQVAVIAADDGVHAGALAGVAGGATCVAAGDDGVHADAEVRIEGGALGVSDAVEGLEALTITLAGGTVRLHTSDDGFNATDTSADADEAGGGPGGAAACDACLLTISGGYAVVDAEGDGVDSNGSIEMSGGVVLVHGPTANDNGPMDIGDSGATFVMTGGVLVAAGSSGMAIAPGETSSQYSALVNLDAAQEAGALFHLQTSAGDAVLTFAPAKTWQSVLVSAPGLGLGGYEVYVGGSDSGAVTDGLYAGGTYAAGELAASYTAVGVVTTVGSSGGGPGPR